MKKIILSLMVVGTILTGCSKDDNNTPEEPKITMDVEYPPIFDNSLYPSFIYSYAQLKTGDETLSIPYFGAIVDSDRDFDAEIRITNDKFIRPTTIKKTLKKGENEFDIPLSWKYDDFITMTKPGNTFFQFQIIDSKSGKLLANQDIQLGYRSINECVFYINNTNLMPNFSAYVNEDSRLIDSFLSETLDDIQYYYPKLQLNGWVGYQLGPLGVNRQILAIVGQLRDKGMKYSSITNTSNWSAKVGSQYVRFIDETLSLKNANCVDGSVLIASILEKIGIRSYLVVEPGHMYLAINVKNEELDVQDLSSVIFIETTAIGSGDLEQVFAPKIIKDGTLFMSIRKARERGIKPIQ